MSTGIEVLRTQKIPDNPQNYKAVVKVNGTPYTAFIGPDWPSPGVYLYREWMGGLDPQHYGYFSDSRLPDKDPIARLITSTLRLVT